MHPSIEELVEYAVVPEEECVLLGNLSGLNRKDIIEHLLECDDCFRETLILQELHEKKLFDHKSLL